MLTKKQKEQKKQYRLYNNTEKTNNQNIKMITTYKNIVRAIYSKARKEKKDVRNFIREWCELFEDSRVVGWDRDTFLDCCIEESKKWKRGKK